MRREDLYEASMSTGVVCTFSSRAGLSNDKTMSSKVDLRKSVPSLDRSIVCRVRHQRYDSPL